MGAAPRRLLPWLGGLKMMGESLINKIKPIPHFGRELQAVLDTILEGSIWYKMADKLSAIIFFSKSVFPKIKHMLNITSYIRCN